MTSSNNHLALPESLNKFVDKLCKEYQLNKEYNGKYLNFPFQNTSRHTFSITEANGREKEYWIIYEKNRSSGREYIRCNVAYAKIEKDENSNTLLKMNEELRRGEIFKEIEKYCEIKMKLFYMKN